MTLSPSVRRDLWALAALGLLTLLVFVLFLPNNGAVSDSWEFWVRFESGEQVLFQPTTRPMVFSIYWLAWSLTPDSFLATNAIQILVFFLKSAAVYGLVSQLAPRAVAFAAGALVLVFPAAIGAIYSGVINVHFSLAMLILAAALLVGLARKPGTARSILMVVALAYSLLSYEMGYPLAIAVPLFLLIGPRATDTRRTLVLWYGTMALCVLVVAVNSVAFGLQGSRVGGLFDVSVEKLPAVGDSLIQSYLRHLAGVFRESAAFIPGRWRSWLTVTALAFGGLTLFSVAALGWRRRQDMPHRTWLLLSAIGFLFIGLGFLPITLTNLRYDYFHTVIYSSFGAALFFAVVLFGPWVWAAHRWPGINGWGVGYALLVGLFVSLFAFRTLDLARAFVSQASLQKEFGGRIVDQLGVPDKGTTVIVLDETERGQVGELFYRRPDYLDMMLRVVYEDLSMRVVTCAGQPLPGTSMQQCQLSAETVEVVDSAGQATEYDLSRVAVFRVTESADGLTVERLDSPPASPEAIANLARRGMLATTPLIVR
jgi:hypothetical protein